MARASLCSRDRVFASAITAQSSLSPRDASLPRCRCRVASWYAARDGLCRLQAKVVGMNLVFGGYLLSAGDVGKIGVRLEGGALGVDVGGGVEGLLSETAEELSRRGQQQVDAELGRRLEARRPKLPN